MKTSMKKLGQAIAEHDFAKRAESYGANGVQGREVICHAIRNLPTYELKQLRGQIQAAIDAAVERTSKRLDELGVRIDCDFPFAVRSAFDDADLASKKPDGD